VDDVGAKNDAELRGFRRQYGIVDRGDSIEAGRREEGCKKTGYLTG